MLTSKQISHFDPNELTINFLSLVSMASVSIHNFDFWDLIMKQSMHCSKVHVNTLRTGDADLRFYITTVQDG